MSEGRKDDSGKVRMELLPPELLEATATILTFGAQKYTSVHVFSNQEAVSWIQELLQSSFPQYAIRIDASIAEGCAETAMNGSFGPTTQSMRRGSAKIDENGGAETLIGLEPWKIDARLALRPGSVIDGQNGPLGCGSTASPQKGLNASSSLRAGSVRSATETLKQSAPSISITVTTPEGYEDFFAVDATTASACFAKMLDCFRKRYPISNPLPLLTFADKTDGQIEITVSGARNWEKGMNWSRVFGALMRHLWAWWRKEEKDVETGKSHLWHAACCIAFLIAYEQRNIGADDRP